MQKLDNVCQQFASFFGQEKLKPYLHELWARMNEGHICLPVAEVSLENLPYLEKADLSELADFTDLISTDASIIRPFVLHNGKMYLQRYFNYETSILKSLERLIQLDKAEREKRKMQLSQMAAFLHQLNADYSLANCLQDEKTDWQMVAAILGFINNFTIITGGPGTGKTTTVAKILSLIYTAEPEAKVVLAAPTGKAAVRMAESLKNSGSRFSQEIKEKFSLLRPNTIHRLLNPIKDSIYFKYNLENPLPYDVIIIDEASMIDAALFAKLLSAIHTGCRLILLGDRNQLASVEVGSLLGDFCRSLETMNHFSVDLASFVNNFIIDPERQVNITGGIVPGHPLDGHIVELRKSHRFTGTGGIGQFSRIVIEGNISELEDLIRIGQTDEVTIDLNSDSALFENYVAEYSEYIQEKNIARALEKFNNVKLLCAVREGERGLYAINKKVEQLLKKKGILHPYEEFYQNRPVIITQNMPDLGLFNGDIGLVRKDANGVMRVWFEDNDKNIKSVLPGYIAEAETVFAMTIHKSQGSEYQKVLIILPDEENNPLLTRELLYTAITRAKNSLLLQANPNVLRRTVTQQVKRISGISERFNEVHVI